MTQRVTITTEASVALQPLLKSAVRTELSMLELGLARTGERLRRFEEQFGMDSDELMRRYSAGQIEETLDLIEWAGEVRTLEILREQQKALEELRFS